MELLYSAETLAMKNRNCRIQRSLMTTLAGFVLTLLLIAAEASDVPAVLPRPDGKPGDASKPVKVYILAGQSNMVGMGEISGAKCRYAGIYLTPDPAAPLGSLAIWGAGQYKILPLKVYGPDGTKADKPIAEGFLEVPEAGVYRIQCDCSETPYATVILEGREVYAWSPGGEAVKREVTVKPGKRYAFKITGFRGRPPRFWLEKIDLTGRGDLETVVKKEGKFPWLVDEKGNWTVRKDVYFYDARIKFRGSYLLPTYQGRTIGPALGFGHVVGTYHDEQVLIIKTAMGNRALGFDFRPPSSGRTDPKNKWESLEYRLMVEGVRKTLKDIDKILPGYKGQGYEIAGFVWWQGHKDSFSQKLIAEYEKNLVNLIKDVRKEFNVPDLPVVVATVGFHGYNMPDKFKKIWEAQMAVGDPKKHPEFAGTVAVVDTRPFWREVDESPANQDYHYNRNAETYMLVGDALGRAMVRLQGGKAEPLHIQYKPGAALQRRISGLTEAENAAAQKALAPIILNSIIPAYLSDPRYHDALLRAAAGERPQRPTQFLRDALFGLVNCYKAAGIHRYDWHDFGPDMMNAEWWYFSFDPPESMPRNKDGGRRYRKVTYPEGMESWMAPDFDAAGAGWKTGLQPFGQAGGELKPLGRCGPDTECRCGIAPRTLWEKEILMIRATFKFPPLKKGCRYRIVVGGSNHVNRGEGFAIYVNGKLLVESKYGVFRRQGGQPRGAFIYSDFRKEFKGGKVTIAVMSFLRYDRKPSPQGHLSVWLEEQQIPPVLLKALERSKKPR